MVSTRIEALVDALTLCTDGTDACAKQRTSKLREQAFSGTSLSYSMCVALLLSTNMLI